MQLMEALRFSDLAKVTVKNLTDLQNVPWDMQGYKTAAITWTVEFAHSRINSSNLTRRGWRHPSGLAGSSLRCTSPSSPQSRSAAPPPFAGHISEQSKRKRHDVTVSVANFKTLTNKQQTTGSYGDISSTVWYTACTQDAGIVGLR